MGRNKYFLQGVFSSLITIVFVVISLTFLSLSFTSDFFSIENTFNSWWYLWSLSAAIVLSQNVFFGTVQILNPGRENKIYVGYLTIFCSFLVFPFFVSLEFFIRSGLTKKEINYGIRRWIINNFDFFYKKLKNEKNNNLQLLDKKFRNLNVLAYLKVSSLKEINAYKLDLLEKYFPQKIWPKVWDYQAILSYYGK